MTLRNEVVAIGFADELPLLFGTKDAEKFIVKNTKALINVDQWLQEHKL